jgi:hypothetical protein
MTPAFEVVVQLPCAEGGSSRYGRLEFRGRCEWRTKRIAEKHARDYRLTRYLDAWVQEA